jgi:hypothetical protein
MKRFTQVGLATLVIAASLAHVAVAAPADPPPSTPSAATAGPAGATTPAPTAAPAPAAVPAPTPATSPDAAPVPAAAAPTAPPSGIAPAATTGDNGATTVNTPPPEKEVPSSLELSLSIGPTVMYGEAANPEYDPSVSRFGVFGSFGIGYRSSYFIDPFIELGYGSLATGEVVLPNGPWGAGGTLKQQLSVVTLSPGITADIWRFRPKIGLGISFVTESYSFGGQEHSSTQPPLLAQLGLGFVAVDVPRFRLDIEARTVIMQGADVHFTTIDIVLRADAIYFGGS